MSLTSPTTEAERLIARVLAENEDLRRPDGGYVLAEATLAFLLRASEEARVKAERERDEAEKVLLNEISKEPPCMYGSNERIYIMSIIAARSRLATKTDGEEKK